jgi:hypothetical protein
MIKKLLLLFILTILLTSPAMAMSKDMTRNNIRFAKAGDIVLVQYTDVAGACDFGQQIVKMPQTANTNVPTYECVYIGSYRRQ